MKLKLIILLCIMLVGVTKSSDDLDVVYDDGSDGNNDGKK